MMRSKPTGGDRADSFGLRLPASQRACDEACVAWWVSDPKPDPVPIMVERGHMHAFAGEHDCRLAEKLRETQIECSKWSAAGSCPAPGR